MDIRKVIEEHCGVLEELLENQDKIIKEQNELINILKKSIEATEKSRNYWINKYYEAIE